MTDQWDPINLFLVHSYFVYQQQKTLTHRPVLPLSTRGVGLVFPESQILASVVKTFF
ncbi:hypothetical protein NC653_004757 [Populus alba x Populus x berolinensis]|uniref:Uncharacterized protein n=1 Tax=Populus alba x Populus x berolinensis TaxID=444605 RepID=A0AAD6RUT7_9ROSI|nr:hypothetical protein NC653_004757 [Populus alba x Populus x berolinensis]